MAEVNRTMSRVRPCGGDVLGALAASAVILPQAMAFGVTLFAVAGAASAAGAFAGLIATAALCTASGAGGGTRGLITAPTGPTLILLVSAATAFRDNGLAAAGILQALAMTIALGGLLQLLIGLAGGGRLIKYIPFPVVSGFMTGSAVLMLTSQWSAIAGNAPGAAWAGWQWVPAVTALATIAGARLLPRWLKKIPGPIAGLLLGMAVFHALRAAHGAAIPGEWVIGVVPGFAGAQSIFSGAELPGLPWTMIVTAAAALAVLASLDTLLTAVVADVATGQRHDSRRELMAQGVGQIVSAAVGGIAGAGTTAATVIAIKSGGGRWVGVCAGLCFVLLAGFAGGLGRYLPIGALAGVIIAVAFDVVDKDILRWTRLRHLRQDAFVAMLVIIITVTYDLMVAVGAGVAIAIVL
ncbi:MAG: SulP family inorganic anion transporter, partial [Gammaproteobacteria bacterium]|nr:SulP family inorganic anion transporter [Gammaproteobacteria bacterium]